VASLTTDFGVGVAVFVGMTAGGGMEPGRAGVKNHDQRETDIGVGVLVRVGVGVKAGRVGVFVMVAVGQGVCVGDGVAVELGVAVALEAIEELRQLAPAISGSIDDKLHPENSRLSAELM
jgi:hypothetical protein